MARKVARKRRVRGNGEGTVYYCDYYNRWVGVVSMGWEDGKLKRRKLYGPLGDRSKAAKIGVEERLRPYITLPRHRRSRSDRLGEFVTQSIDRSSIRSKTKDYYGFMAAHLGKLSSMRLVEVAPIDIRRHLDRLDVGDRTRRGVYSLLSKVFNEATRLELVTRNPVAGVIAPKMPRRAVRALTPAEVGFLLKAVAGDRLEALVILALTTTMGPGELLALRRRDVHLSGGYLWVMGDLVQSKQNRYRPVVEGTKTPRRQRRIDLPKLAIDSLRARLKLCLKEGSGEYVFTTQSGTFLDLHVLRQRWWKPLLKRASALAKKAKATFPEDLRLYELRHTANAIMSHVGVPIELASARMGHASIRTTHDVYGHQYAAAGVDVARKLDSFFEPLRPRLTPTKR